MTYAGLQEQTRTKDGRAASDRRSRPPLPPCGPPATWFIECQTGNFSQDWLAFILPSTWATGRFPKIG
jgi:hypothetical protein